MTLLPHLSNAELACERFFSLLAGARRATLIAMLAAGAAVPDLVAAQPAQTPPSLVAYPEARRADQIDRRDELLTDMFGVVAAGRVLWSSGYDQVVKSPKVWPRDGESYGRRVVTRSAQLVVIESVRHGVAAALERDPAYVRCDCTAFGPRLGHVLKGTVTDFDVRGQRRIGWPRFAGALAGSLALAQLQPGQRAAETVALRAVATVAGSAVGNAAKEFRLWERLTGGRDK